MRRTKPQICVAIHARSKMAGVDIRINSLMITTGRGIAVGPPVLEQDHPRMQLEIKRVINFKSPSTYVFRPPSLDLCSSTSAPRPLSLHLCPSTSVPPPQSLHLCPSTTIPPPLSLHLCPSTSVPQPLSLNLCPSTSRVSFKLALN